jgi:hypothetical protein
MINKEQGEEIWIDPGMKVKAFLIFLIVDLKFKALVFLFSMEFSSFIYI